MEGGVVTGNNVPMSLRAYARHRGCTHPLVVRMVGAGRLDPALRREGKRTLIDARVADEMWPPRKGNGHAPTALSGPRRPAPRGPDDTRAEAERKYWLARARREELRLARESGELEPVATAVNVVREQAMRLRDSMLSAGDRIALRLVNESDLETVRKLLRTAYSGAWAEVVGEGGHADCGNGLRPSDQKAPRGSGRGIG
jgi:hypothetical protein